MSTEYAGNANPPNPDITDSAKIKNSVGLAVDQERKRFYFTDIQFGKILMTSFKGGPITTIAESKFNLVVIIR